jgi:hypothetical protein
MPADSEVTLPRTFRPFGVRIAIYAAGALLLLVALGMWLAFPPEIRAQFTVLQLGTVLVLGLLLYSCGYALARSRVVAGDDGLTVVNGYRTRRFAYNQVIAVTLRAGSPWALLDLSDGSTVPAMGIQGSDGPRAVQQVREVRALVAQRTR